MNTLCSLKNNEVYVHMCSTQGCCQYVCCLLGVLSWLYPQLPVFLQRDTLLTFAVTQSFVLIGILQLCMYQKECIVYFFLILNFY